MFSVLQQTHPPQGVPNVNKLPPPPPPPPWQPVGISLQQQIAAITQPSLVQQQTQLFPPQMHTQHLPQQQHFPPHQQPAPLQPPHMQAATLQQLQQQLLEQLVQRRQEEQQEGNIVSAHAAHAFQTNGCAFPASPLVSRLQEEHGAERDVGKRHSRSRHRSRRRRHSRSRSHRRKCRSSSQTRDRSAGAGCLDSATLADSFSRAQTAAATAAANTAATPSADKYSTLNVDWAITKREPFRKSFIDRYEAIDLEDAASRRLELGIEVENEPSGVGVTPPPLRSFVEAGALPSWVLEALTDNSWITPMPIQAQSLPILLSGRNLVGIAQTGSGKTIAFLLPCVVHVSAQKRLSWSEPGPVSLVLAPTRELAVQIHDEATKLLQHSHRCQEHQGGVRSCCFYGGGKKWEQLRNFTYDGSHIVVATPGRLLDFCREGKVSLQRVTYLVLDEADRMLEMGFREDMDQVGAACRPDRQTVFFSATWPKEVRSLAGNLCAGAHVSIRVSRPGVEGDDVLLAREGISQQVVVVDLPHEAKPWEKQDEEKKRLLDAHIKTALANPAHKMLIFVNQKTFATELAEKVWKEGEIEVDTIHGGRQQHTRLDVLERFRTGEIRLLIATDVVGRGIDIPMVSHVVVYSMSSVEDYIHRIGRTGRGRDAKGHALVFFEYMPKQPEIAGELLAVLERSNQEVPPELRQIAADVANGQRQSISGGWGNKTWDKSSWNTGDWKGGGWKENGWKTTSEAPLSAFQQQFRAAMTAPSGPAVL